MTIKPSVSITATLAGLLLTTGASAVPFLQLDTVGGSYDPNHQDSVITGDSYTIRALQWDLNDGSFDNGIFYLAIALTQDDSGEPSGVPQVSPSPDYGTISVNGTSFHVTADMDYGKPPTDIVDGKPDGNLGGHGIYDTYYLEYDFNFDDSNMIAAYDAETDSSASGNLYFVDFDIDVSLLDPQFSLHFDLYNLVDDLADNRQVDQAAPFSHDASGYPGDGGDGTDGGDSCNPEDPFDPCEVPEPKTLWLFALALLVTSLYRAAPLATSRKF